MKLNLFHTTKSKIKGFMLMEVIVSIGLISILALSLGGVLKSSKDIENKIITSNEDLNDMKYAIDYLINEIDSSDFIETEKLQGILPEKYIGLILVKINENSKEERFSFTTYIYEGRDLVRVNYKRSTYLKSFHKSYFKGNNIVIREMDNFKCNYNESNKLMNIEISKNKLDYKISHHIRGVPYE